MAEWSRAKWRKLHFDFITSPKLRGVGPHARALLATLVAGAWWDGESEHGRLYVTDGVAYSLSDLFGLAELTPSAGRGAWRKLEERRIVSVVDDCVVLLRFREHQLSPVAERVRRHRERQRNDTWGVSVTAEKLPEAEAEAEAEAEIPPTPQGGDSLAPLDLPTLEAMPRYTPAADSLPQPDASATSPPTNGHPANGTLFPAGEPRAHASAKPKRPKASELRASRAREVWTAYEARRLELWPRARGRAVTDDDLRALVKLHEHVRKRLACDEPAAWTEVEAYARGSLEHAHAAEIGSTGDTPEWAARLVRWRADGGEWGRRRYEAWSGGQASKSPRARRRGHFRAEDADHSNADTEEIF